MKKSKVQFRVPIVAVMGHVDHGKTSILDAIRGTNVQKKEAGGITQNTRAHVISLKDGKKITFIDTPGHEAFSGMRSRGAKVTDIVLLVVAADDGVQPQTIESIKFAKEAGVPIVVAINKMDLPGANPAKIKQELAQYDVQVEEFGGDVLVAEVSAKSKKGLDELLDTLMLQAEMLELKKVGLDDDGVSQAVVLESNLNSKLGPVGLLLIKSGEIKENDFIVYGDNVVKIRKLLDENQENIKKADEGEPVWVIGLDEVLDTGEKILIFSSYTQAKKQSRQRKTKVVKSDDAKSEEVLKEEAQDEFQEDLLVMLLDNNKDDIRKLNLVLRTDTKGTLEAVIEQLKALSDDEAMVNILSAKTGEITQKDVELAKTSKAIILGFQVKVPSKIEEIAKREKVPFRIYSIIYDLLDEVSMALDSLVEPEYEEVEVAIARIKKVFVLSDKSKVAGCEVTKGTIVKGYQVIVRRGEEEIARAKIVSLKQKKNEVKDIKKGQECGIKLDPQVDFEVDDEIVAIKKEKL